MTLTPGTLAKQLVQVLQSIMKHLEMDMTIKFVIQMTGRTGSNALEKTLYVDMDHAIIKNDMCNDRDLRILSHDMDFHSNWSGCVKDKRTVFTLTCQDFHINWCTFAAVAATSIPFALGLREMDMNQIVEIRWKHFEYHNQEFRGATSVDECTRTF